MYWFNNSNSQFAAAPQEPKTMCFQAPPPPPSPPKTMCFQTQAPPPPCPPPMCFKQLPAAPPKTVCQTFVSPPGPYVAMSPSESISYANSLMNKNKGVFRQDDPTNPPVTPPVTPPVPPTNPPVTPPVVPPLVPPTPGLTAQQMWNNFINTVSSYNMIMLILAAVIVFVLIIKQRGMF